MTLKAGALVDIGDFSDTGWVALAVASGFTSTLQIRRIGDRVNVKGSITPTTNWGAANASNIAITATEAFDSQYWPPESLLFTCPTAATSALVTFRVGWQSNGQCSVRCDTATHTSAVTLNFDYLVS